MKTEKECLAKLEETVNNINKLADELPQGEEEAPIEVQIKIAMSLSYLATLAWILDQEEELRPLLTTLNAAVASKKFEAFAKGGV